tara:strand:- start:92 stop:214 length:123 start_codon:yes stop_codon:yes gene_type:complete
MVEVNSLLTELRKLSKEQLKEVEFHLWVKLSELELEAADE